MQYDHAWQFRTCLVRWFRTNFGDLLQKSMNGSRWVAQCFQPNFSYVLETKDLVTWVCLRLQTQPKLSKMSHPSISNFTFLVSRSRSASKPWDTQAVQKQLWFLICSFFQHRWQKPFCATPRTPRSSGGFPQVVATWFFWLEMFSEARGPIVEPRIIPGKTMDIKHTDILHYITIYYIYRDDWYMCIGNL